MVSRKGSAPQQQQRQHQLKVRQHTCTDRRAFIVASSVALYWLMVSLIPVYNKYFFRKEYFPFPIATAGIQLGFVSALLTVFNLVQHLQLGSQESFNTITRSWIFGPHLLWKLRTVLPIGLLFGLKYGVTNVGLALVPAPTHLLLQSTDLIWTVLSAWFINKEQTSLLSMLCLCGCVAGSFVLSLQVGQNSTAPILAVAVNLMSPVLLGLCVATLRAACVELMNKDNRVGGTVSAVELTAMKLSVSSAVALVLAAVFESTGGNKFGWLDTFLALPTRVRAGVIGGSLPILIFQVNCTFLTNLTSSVAVGLVGQLKIIPQWIAATLLSSNINFHLTGLNIIGAVLTMASASAFAMNEYFVHSSSYRENQLLISGTDDDGSSSSNTEASALLGMVTLSTSPIYGSLSATSNDVPTLHNASYLPV